MKLKFLLLIPFVFIGLATFCYATKPRSMGVGLKYGYTIDQTGFRGTKESSPSTFYVGGSTDEKINQFGKTLNPIFFQFDEELLNDFLSSYWYLDFGRLVQTNKPPVLKGTTYTDLVNSKSFVVPTEKTYTDQFFKTYPKFSSTINNKTNPALSADYFVSRASFGRTWNIFYPSSHNHRWISLGIGFGINYIEGSYEINVCDPFFISDKLKPMYLNEAGEYREGFCANKTELYYSKVNQFSLELYIPFRFYSYIDQRFEFNLFEYETYASELRNEIRTDDSVLVPKFAIEQLNFFSIVAYF